MLLTNNVASLHAIILIIKTRGCHHESSWEGEKVKLRNNEDYITERITLLIFTTTSIVFIFRCIV